MNKNFTVIKVVFVVLVVGVGGFFGWQQYRRAEEKAHLSGLVVQAYAIRDALRQYQQEHGKPAAKLSNLDIWDLVDESEKPAVACMGGRCFYQYRALPYFRTDALAGFAVCEFRWDATFGGCHITSEQGKALAQELGWQKQSSDIYYIGTKQDWQ